MFRKTEVVVSSVIEFTHSADFLLTEEDGVSYDNKLYHAFFGRKGRLQPRRADGSDGARG